MENVKHRTLKIAIARWVLRRLLKGRDRYKPRSFDNECDLEMNLELSLGKRYVLSMDTVSDGLTGIARLAAWRLIGHGNRNVHCRSNNSSVLKRYWPAFEGASTLKHTDAHTMPDGYALFPFSRNKIWNYDNNLNYELIQLFLQAWRLRVWCSNSSQG